MEAATILCLDKSTLVQDPKILKEICPSLSIYHVKHLVISFQPDKLSPDPVPDKVLKQLDVLVEKLGGGGVDVEELKISENGITPEALQLGLWIEQPLKDLIAYPKV
jgi:hypothetical protein